MGVLNKEKVLEGASSYVDLGNIVKHRLHVWLRTGSTRRQPFNGFIVAAVDQWQAAPPAAANQGAARAACGWKIELCGGSTLSSEFSRCPWLPAPAHTTARWTQFIPILGFTRVKIVFRLWRSDIWRSYVRWAAAVAGRKIVARRRCVALLSVRQSIKQPGWIPVSE